MTRKYLSKKSYGIEILAATEDEISLLRKSLRFLKARDLKYFKILKCLKCILINPKKTYNNLLYSEERVYVCESGTVLNSTTHYLSSLLIHEARHLWQFEHWDIKDTYGDKAEIDAYKVQRKFLVKYGWKSDVEWLDNMYKDKWWVFKDEKGKPTLFSPATDPFTRLVNNYLKGKLNIKKI